MDRETRSRKIEKHRAEIARLEAEQAAENSASNRQPSGFYLTWHVMIGLVLGALAAAVSLAANFLGAPLFGRRALDLIRTYLTFPMGERALALDSATVLTIGCALYLVTGALLGILFHLVLVTYFESASPGRRFLVSTVLGLALWVGSFYLVLSWLQPMLLGGNWIVAGVPWWVGMSTHLAFAWTMAAAESWGHFEDPRREA